MPNKRNTHPMPDEYLAAFRGAIQRRGWTHDQFAKKIGVSREHLNRVLTGKVELSGPLWRRAIKAFGPEAEKKLWACLLQFWNDVAKLIPLAVAGWQLGG